MWLGQVFRHSANEVHHKLTVQTDIIHSQVRDTSIDVLLARREAGLKVVDDFTDRRRQPSLRQFVAHGGVRSSLAGLAVALGCGSQR